MSLVARGTTNGGLTTKTPPSNCRVGSGPAATAIPAATPCYFSTTGVVTMSNGTSANAAAVVDGWTMDDYAQGETVTLYTDVNIGYGKGSAITPGTSYYLGATAGRIDTGATTGGTVPIARGVPDNNITGTKEHKLRVKQSY